MQRLTQLNWLIALKISTFNKQKKTTAVISPTLNNELKDFEWIKRKFEEDPLKNLFFQNRIINWNKNCITVSY